MNSLLNNDYETYRKKQAIKYILFCSLCCLLLLAIVSLVVFAIHCLNDIEDLKQQNELLQSSYSSLKANMLQ